MENIGLFYLGDPSSLPQSRIDTGMNFLQENGFRIVNPDILTSQLSPTEKAKHFNEVYSNPEVEILMSFWGGRDSNAALEYIDFKQIKNKPKPIVGFSDTSALLLAVKAMTDIETYYGPAFTTFTKGFGSKYALQSMISTLRSECLIWQPAETNLNSKFYLDNTFEIVAQEGMKVLNAGSVQAQGVVCCISTLSVLIGTKYLPNLDGNILFLEQSDSSQLTGLKRYLAHFESSGIFKQISGLVFSKFASNSQISPEDLQDLTDLYFNHTDIPVIYNLDFGHTDPISTLRIGGEYKIDTDNKVIEYVY